MQGPKSKGSKASTNKGTKRKAQSSATKTAGATVKQAASGTTKPAKKGKSTAQHAAAVRKTAQKAPASNATSVASRATTAASTPKPTQIPRNAVATPKPTPLKDTTAAPRTISRSEWHHAVELAAYRRAEMRHFAPGGEDHDWIEAEADVNEELLRQGIQILD